MVLKAQKDLALQLAELIIQIGSMTMEAEEVTLIRQHLLDALASAFIGCRNPALEALIQTCSPMKHGYPCPGSIGHRMNSPDAAMSWAFAINASVFEDGSREGACHPAAAVVPAVIAMSEGVNWDRIDRATMAGYDVMVRLARGGNPLFTKKGFHPTSITAPFGAAAAASVLLGHDLEKALNAQCLAAQGSAGLMSAFKCGATQPLQVAWGVRSGAAAALLAEDGLEGYPQIIEEGFYPAYLGCDPNPSIDQPLERQFAIKGSYLKPYPGCRHLHPSIDAFREVFVREGLTPDDVAHVTVRTYHVALETEIHELNTRGDAYFNIPYALSARAFLGRNDYDAFDEKYFSHEGIRAFMEKIEVHGDHELNEMYPRQRGAIVEVHKVGGEIVKGQISHPLGEPENPLSLEETRGKFRVAAADFLKDETIGRIEEQLLVSTTPDSPRKVFGSLSALG